MRAAAANANGGLTGLSSHVLGGLTVPAPEDVKPNITLQHHHRQSPSSVGSSVPVSPNNPPGTMHPSMLLGQNDYQLGVTGIDVVEQG